MHAEFKKIEDANRSFEKFSENFAWMVRQAVLDILPVGTRVAYVYRGKLEFSGHVREVRVEVAKGFQVICHLRVQCTKTDQFHLIRLDNITKIEKEGV